MVGTLPLMPDKELNPEDVARIQEALRYLPDWLRFRELNQRRLAEALEVSEPTISKWLKGGQAMSVSRFLMIAKLLRAQPEDLFSPPPPDGSGAKFHEMAELLDGLPPEDVETVLNVARRLKKS